jgi:hypothetical protein
VPKRVDYIFQANNDPMTPGASGSTTNIHSYHDHSVYRHPPNEISQKAVPNNDEYDRYRPASSKNSQ